MRCPSKFKIEVAGTTTVLPFQCDADTKGHAGRHYGVKHGYYIRWNTEQETSR
jgi:hypothetical protein